LVFRFNRAFGNLRVFEITYFEKNGENPGIFARDNFRKEGVLFFLMNEIKKKIV